MERFKFIGLAEAETMSANELQMEIDRRAKYLREEFGMDRTEVAHFIASLLNMGVVMNEMLTNNESKEW